MFFSSSFLSIFEITDNNLSKSVLSNANLLNFIYCIICYFQKKFTVFENKERLTDFHIWTKKCGNIDWNRKNLIKI